MKLPREYLDLLHRIERIVAKRYILNNNSVGALSFFNRTIPRLQKTLPRNSSKYFEREALKLKVFILMELGSYKEALNILKSLLRKSDLQTYDKFGFYHYLLTCFTELNLYKDAEKLFRKSVLESANSNYPGELASFMYDLCQFEKQSRYRVSLGPKEKASILKFCQKNKLPAPKFDSSRSMNEFVKTIFNEFYLKPGRQKAK